MSEPFAVKRYDATAEVPGCECCGPSVDFTEEKDGDWVKIEDHNAAVTARERKAAAQALREAADVAWCETCTDDMRIKEWFRNRADAIEKGER